MNGSLNQLRNAVRAKLYIRAIVHNRPFLDQRCQSWTCERMFWKLFGKLVKEEEREREEKVRGWKPIMKKFWNIAAKVLPTTNLESVLKAENPKGSLHRRSGPNPMNGLQGFKSKSFWKSLLVTCVFKFNPIVSFNACQLNNFAF